MPKRRDVVIGVVLLVVAAVLITFLALTGSREGPFTSACETEVSTIRTALDAWRVQYEAEHKVADAVPTMADLVASTGYLKKQPTYYDLLNGSIVLTDAGRREECLLDYP